MSIMKFIGIITLSQLIVLNLVCITVLFVGIGDYSLFSRVATILSFIGFTVLFSFLLIMILNNWNINREKENEIK